MKGNGARVRRSWFGFSFVAFFACGDGGSLDGSGGPVSVLDMGFFEDAGPMVEDLGGSDTGEVGADQGGEDAGAQDMGARDLGDEMDAVAQAALDEADAQPGLWTWVPVQGARCRDGSETGFMLRTQPEAAGLVIYLEGGGACFNRFTCPSNPSSFDAEAAATRADGLVDGIFDDGDLDNPVAGWNAAYIPYCTGDVFAGTRSGVRVDGVDGAQDFVGYDNVGRFSALLAERYATSSQVLVTGISAGGFGALFNFDQIAARFPEAERSLLDDSGQPLAFGDALSACLTEEWVDLWGMPLPSDCEDCTPSTDGLRGIARHLRRKYPDARLALASYLQDVVIRSFFLFGKDDCRPTDPSPIPGSAFEDAVLQFRDDHPSWATYFVEGIGHTFLRGRRFEEQTLPDTAVADWLGALLAGENQDLGPDAP